MVAASASEPGERAGADQRAALDFDGVYDEHFDEVVRWLRALGGAESELDDLAQEVFVVVQRQLGRFDGRSLRAWLYRIAANTVSDWRRRAWFRHLWRRRETVGEELASAAPGPVEDLERREAGRTLARLLGRLSRRRRSVFVLFEIEGLSGEEIAELEGISVTTVWTRLHRARRDLAALVARQRESEAP